MQGPGLNYQQAVGAQIDDMEVNQHVPDLFEDPPQVTVEEDEGQTNAEDPVEIQNGGKKRRRRRSHHKSRKLRKSRYSTRRRNRRSRLSST